MKERPFIEIDGFRLVMTCGACPEQYDVFRNSKLAGYLRLRHGFFRAQVPYCGGETIYEATPNGDGCFEDEERDDYLREAVAAIRKHYELQRARTDGLLEALKEARDLLLERKQGSPARSAAHNARLVIEAAIAKAEPSA